MPARKKRAKVAPAVEEQPRPAPAPPVEQPATPSPHRSLWTYVFTAICLLVAAALVYLAIWLS